MEAYNLLKLLTFLENDDVLQLGNSSCCQVSLPYGQLNSDSLLSVCSFLVKRRYG